MVDSNALVPIMRARIASVGQSSGLWDGYAGTKGIYIKKAFPFNVTE